MTLWKWNQLVAVSVAVSLLTASAAQMISVDRTGTNAGGTDVGELYVVSGDGRYAAFSSSGTNYVANDTNGLSDIFVSDCLARSNVWNTCYSKAPAATLGFTFDSRPIHFTPDGRFLLFASRATNHVPGNVYPLGQSYQLYVRDLLSNVTHLVTVAHDGTNGTANGTDLQYFRHRLSSDGRFVVFASHATNLVIAGENFSNSDVFCRDLVNQTTELVTVTPDGTSAIDHGTMNFFASTNARYIAFETTASNVISGFTNNGMPLTYWRDRMAGTTLLVGVTTNGARARGSVLLHSLSSDGRYVAFRSVDTNLTSDVIYHSQNFNLFIRDMFLGQTWTVNRHPAGYSTGNIAGAQFSSDGQWLLFTSSDTDIVPGVTDVNGSSYDLFVHYLPWRTNGLLSMSFTGNQGASGYVSEDFARLSSSGRFTLFTSFSTNLLPNTSDAVQRFFLRDQRAGITRNAVHPLSFPTPSFNGARHIITENERWVFFITHANFDPSVRKTNSAIELFRMPLFSPRLTLANSNIIVAEGLASLTYVIESSSNLLHWTAIRTNNADAHGSLVVKNPEPFAGGSRFYRLVWP